MRNILQSVIFYISNLYILYILDRHYKSSSKCICIKNKNDLDYNNYSSLGEKYEKDNVKKMGNSMCDFVD